MAPLTQTSEACLYCKKERAGFHWGRSRVGHMILMFPRNPSSQVSSRASTSPPPQFFLSYNALCVAHTQKASSFHAFATFVRNHRDAKWHHSHTLLKLASIAKKSELVFIGEGAELDTYISPPKFNIAPAK